MKMEFINNKFMDNTSLRQYLRNIGTVQKRGVNVEKEIRE
jgi:hypothetical protein